MKHAQITFICLLMLCAPAIAYAQGEEEDATANRENRCSNEYFLADGPDFKLIEIVGEWNVGVRFFSDEGDCPKLDDPKCRQKSYLIPGDLALASRRYGSWVCGWYQPKKGDATVGWLPITNLFIIEQPPTPPLEQWVGTWTEYDNSLNIKRDGTTPYLKVEGQAYWHGLGNNVNEGSFATRAEPQGNQLLLEDDGCKVTLSLVGAYLIAHDNFQCGGMNVRFNGVYLKR